MQALGARLFRFVAKADKCPGEAACDIFDGAADIDDLDETGKRMGKAHVCRICPKVGSKPGTTTALTADDEILLDWLLRTFQARSAGHILNPEDVSATQWECWLELLNLEDEFRRADLYKTSALYDLMVRLLTKT